MAQRFQIHPHDPQLRLLRQAAQIINYGGLAAVPTDSCYALACHLDDKDAVDRLRRIRNIDERRDLGEIAAYAKVDNAQYRLLKQATPGPYTFILEATREVPRRLSHPSRKTIGIRFPSHPVLAALLEVLDQSLISTTLLLPGDELPLNDPDDIRDRLQHAIDVLIDAGACGVEPTTVIDLTGREPAVLRQGKGALAPLGL